MIDFRWKDRRILPDRRSGKERRTGERRKSEPDGNIVKYTIDWSEERGPEAYNECWNTQP